MYTSIVKKQNKNKNLDGKNTNYSVQQPFFFGDGSHLAAHAGLDLTG
jgi:predicted heme/steroid binding protein